MAKRNLNKKKTAVKAPVKNSSYLEKIQTEVQSNQSKVSMVLGALIILVVGVLIFNYFNKNKASLGPAQEAQLNQETASNLPAKHTVKEGDTLYILAQKYYNDGFKFSEIAKANNLKNVDLIEAGQVLDIPELDKTQIVQSSLQPSPAGNTESLGVGGGNSTIWGERIEGDKYNVKEGDWLSSISGRAYGDIFAFEKIAKANNIQNPNQIEVGSVLIIPR